MEQKHESMQTQQNDTRTIAITKSLSYCFRQNHVKDKEHTEDKTRFQKIHKSIGGVYITSRCFIICFCHFVFFFSLVFRFFLSPFLFLFRNNESSSAHMTQLNKHEMYQIPFVFTLSLCDRLTNGSQFCFFFFFCFFIKSDLKF